MDKQLSDHMEHRIREALENVSPPFREEAWEKMELLLNKEFEKRRPLAFIFWLSALLLVLLGGIGFYRYETEQPEPRQATRNHSQAGTTWRPAPKDRKNYLLKTSKDLHQPSGIKAPEKNNTSAVNKPVSLPAPSGMHAWQEAQRHMATSVNQENTGSGRTRRSSGITVSSGIPGNPTAASGDDLKKLFERLKAKDDLEEDRKNAVHQNKLSQPYKLNDTAKAAETTLPPVTANVNKQETADSTLKNTKSEKKVKAKHAAKPLARTFFTLSVAREAVDVKKYTLHNLKPVYGAGIGYYVSKRLSVQTGFYIGRKIYKARPQDYSLKAGSYLSSVTMKSIEGNCYIYDIPLSARYDILHKQRFNLYAGAGISSYIMRKETYVYHYTGSSGYGNRKMTYTGNRNLFSVAGLSLGCEYAILNGWYVQASPYLKTPLSGIGDGRIKLYTAGFQAGIKYQPVKKKPH